MSIATINRFIQIFNDALESLSAKASLAEVEQLAMMVHRSLNPANRAYHDSSHVLPLSQVGNPRQKLAALFHDSVYLQLDRGFEPHVRARLDDAVQMEAGEVRLRSVAIMDSELSICLQLFGYEPGQVLPAFGGMNEFLSAVLATRLLKRYLSTVDLIAVAACIEATIPFRGPDAKGRSAAQVLAQRVLAQLQERVAGISTDQAQAAATAIVRDAVGLANRDVGGFADPDARSFLSSTWLLIEESNAPLNAVGVYSIQEYREALMRMDRFLSNLSPASVYQSFDGYPHNDIIDRLQTAAGRNISFAVSYLRAKIATIAIVEACASCTGGDCPVSMLLGDIRGSDGKPDRVEDFLPQAPVGPDFHADLLQVLERGRSVNSRTDLTESPVTAFVYRSLGHEGTESLMESARALYADRMTPLEFLRSTDRGTVLAIIRACSKIALSRSESLRSLEGSLRA